MEDAGYIDSTIWVRPDLVDVDRLKSELWISNLAVEKKQELGYRLTERDTPGVCLWEEANGWISVPRSYPLPFLYKPHGLIQYNWEDTRPKWDRLDGWRFVRRLRPAQEQAAVALVNGHTDKLLCLGCGKGKTTISLWYAAGLGLKTLIIVDRDFLVDQWLQEIKKCLWIPEHYVGLIQGKTHRIGEKLTIGVINTIRDRLDQYDPEFYNQFGLVIIDEAHMLGAPTFAQVVPRFPGERLLLTATPTRKDGMHPVFMYHGGGLTPCYTDLSRDQSSSWYFLQLPQIISDEDEGKCFRRIPGRSRWDKQRRKQVPVMAVQRPVYDTLASKSYEFNRIIIDEVLKAASTGRNVLVLGSRVEQLEMLSKVVGEHYETGFVAGEITGSARKAAFKKQCLFITDRIGSRALDVPRLDTLYLLFPSTDDGFIRQTVGRIDREHEGKGRPIVVVFSHPTLQKKEREMHDVILEVDPEAQIRYLRRS